jgi:hypothetical protein
MNRIKTITSHVGLGRWLSETNETPIGYLARCQCEHIPSPYAYSPSVRILDWNGRPCVYFEVRHKRYEVYEVPQELLRFKNDDDACNWHLRFCRKSA